jgi:hypothetical protein
MKLTTTLAAGMLLSTVAWGQSPATDPEPAPPTVAISFEALDRNSDQRLSKTEAASDDTVSSQFASLDANADGYLNRNEYSHATVPMPPRQREPLPDEPADPDPGV